MNRHRSLILLLLAGLALACTVPFLGSALVKPADEPARALFDNGRLVPETDLVEHGQETTLLAKLTAPVQLYAGIVVRVTQGGRALLDFGDEMQLFLWNDTQARELMVNSSPNTPLDVQLFLEDGGFTGELTAVGGQALFRTPGNVDIRVLGTQFFVVHDPVSRQTVVGNFGGTIEVDDNGRHIPLTGRHFVVLPGGGPLPLPLTLADFEALIRRHGSPIGAAGILIAAANQVGLTPAPTATVPPTPTPTATATATPTATPSPTLTPTPCGPPGNWPAYIVQRGDTLSALARATGTSVAQLKLANCLESDLIYAGQRLFVPRLPPPPPTRTPRPPRPTPRPTQRPTDPPVERPTDPPVAPPPDCRELRAYLSAEPSSKGGVVYVSWDTTGGCPPFAGSLTAQFSGDRRPYATYAVRSAGGQIVDQPPSRCEGQFTIVYELTLYDGSRQTAVATAAAQMTWIC